MFRSQNKGDSSHKIPGKSQLPRGTAN